MIAVADNDRGRCGTGELVSVGGPVYNTTCGLGVVLAT